MYKLTYGGKKGKSISLVESPNLVAIRTKGNKAINQASLNRDSQEVVDESREVLAFPEAGVSVRKVDTELGLESTGSTRKRDAARATLKKDDNIRFAGRVLQDADSGEVMLYTENFFVKFLDDVPEKECLALLKKYALKVKDKLVIATNSYFVEASEGTGLEVFDISEKLLAENQVEYCHPEIVRERRFKGIHPHQWHLTQTAINGRAINEHVNIEKAWAHTKGKGITIAVIDDGVDLMHPEFAGRIVHPFNATQKNNDPNPKFSGDDHGTACAGMACAAGLPGGASGTAPEARLMPIRLISGLGSMAETNAFVWAADHGADVISCSWGPPDGDWSMPMDPLHMSIVGLPDSSRLAMEYVLTKGRKGKGAVILFAAGNGNEDIGNDGYASYPGVIAVAACNDSGKRCVYSDKGEAIWVSFPSADYEWSAFRHPKPLSKGLRTTDRLGFLGYTVDNYVDDFGGTSAACPGMAGIVALMLAANPDLSPAAVKALIQESCMPIDKKGGKYDANGHSNWYGYGRIDAGLAVENARNAADAVAIEGAVQFQSGAAVALKPGVLIGADFKPVKRVLGFSLRLKPASAKLKLYCQVNTSSDGIVESREPGAFVGTTNKYRRIMGFALKLEGSDANNYDLLYHARLKGRKTLAKAKNGKWCGTNKKKGRTVEALSVLLKAK